MQVVNMLQASTLFLAWLKPSKAVRKPPSSLRGTGALLQNGCQWTLRRAGRA